MAEAVSEEKAAPEGEEEEEEEEEEYEVERIIRSKKMKGVKYYLVRWKGYGSDDDTWEPEENLVDCAEALDEFRNKEKEKQAAREAQLRKEEEKLRKEEKRKDKISKVAAGQKRKREKKRFFSSDDNSDSKGETKIKADSKKLTQPSETKPTQKSASLSFASSSAATPISAASVSSSPLPTPQKEQKKTYRLMSDADDTLGLYSTSSRPDKKKIPKLQKTESHKKPIILDNAEDYFKTDPHEDIIRARREKKRKRRKSPSIENRVKESSGSVETAATTIQAPPTAPVHLTEKPEFEPVYGHLDDLILPFGVDIRIPHLDGVYRVTQPIPLEFEDPSGKMSGLENINWSLAVYYDALDLLIRSNCIQDVETLLSKQKLNINQIYGERTLVSLAAFHGKRRMTHMLLRFNPDVNQLIDKGKIALHLAAQQGHTEICVNLIEAGSNINARDAILETALMKAAENGHRSTVEMLLDYGSNFSLVNASFKTAEDIAREQQHEFIAQKIHHRAEQIADAFIYVHKSGCTLKDQLIPIHTIFPEFNSTFTLAFSMDYDITCKLIISRLNIRKGDIGKLLDYSLITCQWMNQLLSLEYPGSVVFTPRIGLNTLVLNFKEHIKKYGIEPLLVSVFSVVINPKRQDEY